MNRITVVFLALAILLAHTLAIHQTPSGDFGPPYGSAHVAFRLGRNLVHDGAAAWDAISGAGAWSEAYPSTIWIALAALCERLQLYPTISLQALGILSTLATIVVLTQFSTHRTAGLIAPVLLATTGATAAAASSGTEAPLAMLFLTTAYLAFRRGAGRLLCVSLVLLALTRPEGLFLALVMTLLEWIDRPRGQAEPGRPPRRSQKSALLATVAILFGLTALRKLVLGSWFAPTTRNLLAFDGERIALGFAYLRYFVRTTPAVLPLLLPLILLVLGRASGTGRRALVLFLAWALTVVLYGGDPLPLGHGLAPALPLAFLSIQSEITAWLDRTPRYAMVAWGILSATVVASFLASKLPGDLGPIRLEAFLERWMQPSARIASAFPHRLDREGLLAELRQVEKCRRIGIFLRDKVPADARIATFWPGAIGYLSRRNVTDLLGRAQELPEQPPQSWSGLPRIDLVRALEEPADYLILATGSADAGFPDLLFEWLSRYDVFGDTQERRRRVRFALQRFELISVPVPARDDDPDVVSDSPFLLLRAIDLGLAPSLEVLADEDEPGGFRVEVRHDGQRQVVDLSVRLEIGQETWFLEPTGDWSPDPVVARASLLVYDTGTRPIRMITGLLPADAPRGRVVAQLHSTGMPSSSLFAFVGDPAETVITR